MPFLEILFQSLLCCKVQCWFGFRNRLVKLKRLRQEVDDCHSGGAIETSQIEWEYIGDQRCSDNDRMEGGSIRV